jgi:hypothetical protein
MQGIHCGLFVFVVNHLSLPSRAVLQSASDKAGLPICNPDDLEKPHSDVQFCLVGD